MAHTSTIRVEWQKRAFTVGYTAFAAEDKAGYKKGDIVSHIGFQPKVFPKELCVLVKTNPNEQLV